MGKFDELHDAILFSTIDEESVRCNLCAHRCRILNGKYGRCRVRYNHRGVLKTLTYDQLSSMSIDPIEKKPLFHFLPGSKSLSIATPGCNFTCDFCQNWRLSQAFRGEADLACQSIEPSRIVETAIAEECASISYTYSEPTIFFELARDVAIIASDKGVKNCFVSNGFMTPEAVREIAPYLDAINVDLKCFSDETYRGMIGGTLNGVLDCIRELAKAGIWIEITTLIVPGMNDSPRELKDIARFIYNEIGANTPWHVSRFHGDYKMSAASPTDIGTLTQAAEIGVSAGLKHVYCGNLHGAIDENTYCSNCHGVVIERCGYRVVSQSISGGCCPDCGVGIDGVWE